MSVSSCSEIVMRVYITGSMLEVMLRYSAAGCGMFYLSTRITPLAFR